MDTQLDSNQNQNFNSPDEQREFGDKILTHTVNSRWGFKDSILFILSQVLLGFIFVLINGGTVRWYLEITSPDVQKAYNYATLTAVVIVLILAVLVNLYWARRRGIDSTKKVLKTILHGLLIVGISVAVFFLLSFIVVVLALRGGW